MNIIKILKNKNKIFYLVLFVFLCAGAILGTLTFVVLQSYEIQLFERQYEAAADLMQSSIEAGFDRKVKATTHMAKIFANSFNKSSWPNVTLPGFEKMCSYQLEIAEVRELEVFVLVTGKKRKSWEAYAASHVDLLNGGPGLLKSINGSWPVSNGIALVNYSISLLYSEVSQNPLYAVVWQVAPIAIGARAVMIDGYRYNEKLLDSAARTQNCVLTDTIQLVEDGTKLRPSALLVCPIIYSADNSHTLLGYLVAVFSWDTVITQSLPDDVIGLELVMQSPAKEFTYSITGQRYNLKGVSDLHDTKYDSYRRTALVAVNAQSLQSANYSFHLYPTKDFEDDYISNDPYFFSVCMAVLIATIGVLFIIYDYLVQAHEADLEVMVNQVSSLVDQFFPAFVRRRLEARQRQSRSNTSNDTKLMTPSYISIMLHHGYTWIRTHIISHCIHITQHMPSPTNTNNDNKVYPSEPANDIIAETYESATVLFADIAGFTSWSCQHSPAEVFHLLECLFSSFDEAAIHHGAYKVCTIGDW